MTSPAGRLRIVWIDPRRFTEHNRSYAGYQRLLFLARQHEVFLITKKNPDLPRDMAAVVSRLIECPLSSRNFYLDNLFFLGFAPLATLRLYLRNRIDFIYAGGVFTYLVGLVFKVLAHARWIVDIEEYPPLQMEWLRLEGKLDRVRRFYYGVKLLLLRKTVRYADFVIVLGVSLDKGFPRRLVERYGVDRERVQPIPMGIDLARIGPRRVGTCPNGAFTLAYSGSLSRTRGLPSLLCAVAALKERIPGLKLLLVGPYKDAAEREHLEAMVHDLELEDQVDYRGFLPHEVSLGLIAHSSICVCPFPKIEVFEHAYSLKIPEYLALGKAVIATDLECTRAHIRSGENGLLTCSNSPDELAAAILRLHKDAGLRRKFEEHAREAVADLDWSGLHAGLDERIRELAQKGRGRRGWRPLPMESE